MVNTGSVNDGAVVLVQRADPDWSAVYGNPCWIVRGEQLAGFDGNPWPVSIGDEVSCPDKCLRRIDPDQAARDARTELEVSQPATENACLTT